MLLIKSIVTKNLLSSSNKSDISSKNLTELRKGQLDKVKTKTLQLNKMVFKEELMKKFIKSAKGVTNIVNFCNKVACDTISMYNQLKQEFNNIKFNQIMTNIHLDDIFNLIWGN